MIKKIIVTLIILLIISGCNESLDHKLKGNWQAYKTTFGGDKNFASDLRFIVTVENDSLLFMDFRSLMAGEDSSGRTPYLLIDSNLIIFDEYLGPDTITIERLDKNELVLSNGSSKQYFSRLLPSKTESSVTDFAGKIFTLSDSVKIYDTLEFIDRSVVIIDHLNDGRPELFYWKIKNYLNNDFLIIGDGPIPIYIVQKVDKNVFKLKRHSLDTIRIYYTEIEVEPKFQKQNIIGNWSGYSENPKSNPIYKFDQDSVQTNDITFGELITCKYSFNLTGDLFYFYNDMIYQTVIYKIHSMSVDSLIISRMSSWRDTIVLTKMN